MLLPGMCYPWLPGWCMDGQGPQGVRKRLTVEPAPFSLLLLLSSTYNSPGQELVPEGSPFLQAEEDTPCKRKTQTPS